VTAKSLDLYSSDEVAALNKRGVHVVDPCQTYISRSVSLERIAYEGTIFYPGTRLTGERCFIGPHSVIGETGPVSLDNVCLTGGVSIASGHIAGSLLLDDVSIGPNAFVRKGCVLEESSSIAHAVGLKQTILFPYVTLGSLINLCDIFVSGGTSSHDHSEVGSSFIHFNFTPNGPRGDKATASLLGNVPDGVFLDQARIFLGGQSGIVGPVSIGFGSVLAAGAVYRKDVARNQLVLGDRPLPGITKARREVGGNVSASTMRKNIRYIGNIAALRVWYRAVRALFWVNDHIATFADQLLEDAVAERIKQVDRLLERIPTADRQSDLVCSSWMSFCVALKAQWLLPISSAPSSSVLMEKACATLRSQAECSRDGYTEGSDDVTNYLSWVHSLSKNRVADMRSELERIVSAVEALYGSTE